MERNTIQRIIILEVVRSMRTHPTADEVYDIVKKKCPSVSKGTVYRNLNKLADDGEILRVGVANAPDRYDSTTGDHCHFRCLGCGNVYDFDCMSKIDLSEYKKSEFTVTGCDMVFNGYCGKCGKEHHHGQQSTL